MALRAGSSRRWKTMISSMRLRNSGRKVARSASRTAASARSGVRASGDALHAEQLRADVAGHDEDGVLERDRAALAVREAAVVEDLEEDVEDVRVGLLDLVEQDDLVGAAAHGLGELAALLVADVAGRRADEAADRVALHVLAHVDAGHGRLVVEEELRQGARGLRLADAGGAQEDEAADGPARVLEPGARPAHGVGDGRDGLVLADDALVQALLHVDELGLLALHEAGHGDARPRGHDAGDVVGVDLLLEQRGDCPSRRRPGRPPGTCGAPAARGMRP